MSPIEIAAAAVEKAFPGLFLIPIPAFAGLTGRTPGSIRNKSSAGTLEVRTVLQGKKRYVPAPEAISYLAKKYAEAIGQEVGEDVTDAAFPAPTAASKGRKKKYSAAARASAAARKASRATAVANASGEVSHG